MRGFRLILTLLIPAALGLSACAGGYVAASDSVLSNVDRGGDWRDFQYCGGWGCSDPREGSFTDDEWAQVVAVMTPPAATAADERDQLAHAIGVMETIMGGKTGYDRDRPGTGSGLFQPGQLDCFSEATNTSSFLSLIHHAGLMHFHTPAEPIMRGQAAERSWRQTHATAALTEDENGILYAMDSWFFGGGHDAIWVDAETWGGAWAPSGGASI